MDPIERIKRNELVMRKHAQSAYPFLYNFVPYPGVNGGEGPDGYTLPANGKVKIPIQLTRDLPYQIFYFKYGAYHVPGGSTHKGQYADSTAGPASWSDYLEFYATRGSRAVFYPHLENVRASLYVTSQSTQWVYGGTMRGVRGGGSESSAPRVTSLQGERQGFNMLRSPLTLQAGGSVSIELENVDTFDLFINGFIFGYKFKPKET